MFLYHFNRNAGNSHVAQYRIGKMLYYGIRYDQDIENAAE